MSYYDDLGVDKKATHQEIKSAYRKLAKQHHPDSGGNNEKFKKINEAYSIVGDENKRKEYDNEILGEGFNFHQKNSNQFHFNQKDFFDQFFAGTSGFHHSYNSATNKDIEARVSVKLKEIFVEQHKTLKINQGRSEATVQVKIPPGVNSGTRIRYKGYGQNILTQQTPGDLLVKIDIQEDEKFIRKNYDLYTKINVDVFDAMIGCEIEFLNLDNNKLKIKIPECCQNEQMLRINGKGLPNKENRGDLYILVQIKMPKKLNHEQKHLVESIKKIS